MTDATTLWFETALLPDGWARRVRVAIAGGTIARVDRNADPLPGDDRHGIALPGLPNLHSHAFQRGMAGLAEARGPGADSFWTWREIMYRFVDRMTPDDVRAIAALAYAEMLEGGFTRVAEFHYLHHAPDGGRYADPAETAAAIATAADEAGIGLTLLPVHYAWSGFGATPPTPAQRRFVNDLDGFARLVDAARCHLARLDDAVLGVAPHSLRATAPHELGSVAALAGGGPVHIHVAEQVREVDDCIAWCGARPVEWLLDNAAVDDRWCLVHATHVTDQEVMGIVARRAVVGLCPITEANLGDGLFRLGALVAANGRYGIGSDSNVRIDASEELRLLEYGQRLATRVRNVASASGSTGEALYRAALDGGAAACGIRAELAPGLSADIVALDADHPSLVAREGPRLVDGLVFAAGRDAIDTVWRRGRCVVRGGRHVRHDAIAARYRTMLARLLA